MKEDPSQSPEAQRKADKEDVYRKIADFVDHWRACEQRACGRARRCAAVENPCFEVHRAEFDGFVREKIIPFLQKHRGDPRYDPDAATETGDGFHEKAPPR